MINKVIRLFLIRFILSFDYDELIESDSKKIYTTAPIYKERTFLIKRDNTFSEIVNFYGKITVKKNKKTIAILKEGEENSYSFKQDFSNYFLIFEFPSPFQICGFIIRSNSSEFNHILSSSLYLIFLKKRNFSFTIINNETIPKLISINFGIYGNIILNNVSIEDSGKNFIPKKNNNNYYAIFIDKLTFKGIILNKDDITLYPYPYYSTVGINLNKNIEKVISKNNTICLNKGDFSFYTFKYIENSFYELSFSSNSLLNFMKNNFEKESINLISKYDNKKINNSFLFFESLEDKGCFSTIISYNENIINNNTDFKLTLYDSRNYDITIINQKNKISQISFKRNNYYNLSKIFLTSTKEILDNPYLDDNNNYIFKFEHKSNETKIQLQFEKINNIKLYEVTFSFNEQVKKDKSEDFLALVYTSYFSGFACIFIFIVIVCQEWEASGKNQKKYGINLRSLLIIFCCRRKIKKD